MGEILPPGPKHERFMKWAEAKGVGISGVHAARIPGKGVGIFAKRKIEPGEELVKVPTSTLLTTNSVPKTFGKRIGQASIQGIIAAFLAFGGQAAEQYEPWKASWPTWEDFETTMPMLWPAEVRGPLKGDSETKTTIYSLPPAIGGRWAHENMRDCNSNGKAALLSAQENKFVSDWSIISKSIPNAKRSDYLYYWLITNTRSFYYEIEGEEPPEKHDDRMVLVPYMDYFNHNDHGCNVAFDKDWYSVTSDREYEAGEEIFTCYGSHSNDFLLVEYGFILEKNKWDTLPLDDFFLGQRLNESKRTQLKNSGYLWNYRLDSGGICHRTEVAIRSLTMNLARWKRFVQGRDLNQRQGETDSDKYIVINILEPYIQEASSAINILELTDLQLPAHVKGVLLVRWKQIRDLVMAAVVSQQRK